MIDSIPVPSTRKHQLHTKITQAGSRHHHSPPLPAVNHHLRLNLHFASTDNQTNILSQSLDLKNLHQITFITRHDRSPCKSSVILPPHHPALNPPAHPPAPRPPAAPPDRPAARCRGTARGLSRPGRGASPPGRKRAGARWTRGLAGRRRLRVGCGRFGEVVWSRLFRGSSPASFTPPPPARLSCAPYHQTDPPFSNL